MRKIFIALAAIAAVGCSKEMTPNDMPTNETFALNASIVLDDTRVTIGGDKFTEVGWVAGDKIRVESVAGFNAELEATESGRENIRFEGTEPYQAAVDTYYAVYPSSNINDAKVTFYLDNQPGDDVAALVAKAEGVESAGLTMEFKPVNSLLHVAVNGVESLSKAEFKSYTGKALVADFTYNYADDTIEYGTATVASYEVETPSADGFFFSLPADLDMSEGYVVTLTDANGNVCAKSYNGMSFERGKTTRVNIEWSIPSVTLGAKTSYSYYLAGDSATANKCANTDIFFVTGKNGENCASSYAGVQDAMITDLGYEVDGTTYTYSAGQVSWDKAANTFCINEVPSYSTAWGEKTGIKAFIVVNGKKVYSPNNLWLTGLPYSYNFVDGSLDAYRSAGWSTNGKLRVSNETLWGRSTTLVLCHRRYVNYWIGKADEHEKGYVVSPKFFVPATTMVQPSIVHSTYYSGGDLARTTYVGAVSNTTSSNTTAISFSTTGGSSTGGTIYGANVWQNSFGLTASTPYISIDCNDTTQQLTGAYYFLHEAHFRYAE